MTEKQAHKSTWQTVVRGQSLGMAMGMAVTALLAGASGCQDAVGCDFREIEGGLNNGAEDRCQERTGFQAAGFDVVCDGLGGAAVDGGCDREGIVFGCVIGEDVIDWYYEPHTIDDATLECGSDEVVDPP